MSQHMKNIVMRGVCANYLDNIVHFSVAILSTRWFRRNVFTAHRQWKAMNDTWPLEDIQATNKIYLLIFFRLSLSVMFLCKIYRSSVCDAQEKEKKMVKEIYNKRSAIWYIAMHNQCACHDLAYVRQYECMHLCVRPPVQFSQSIYTHEAIATVEKHTPPPHSLTVSGKQNSQIKSVWV